MLRTLRAGGADLPVVIITARDAVADRIAGLDAGADDYIVKPFDLDEVAARIRAVARRRAGRAAAVIEYGSLRVDPAARQVFLDDKDVALSARELGFGGSGLGPSVVPVFRPGTQWAPLRRERVPSPLDRPGRRAVACGVER